MAGERARFGAGICCALVVVLSVAAPMVAPARLAAAAPPSVAVADASVVEGDLGTRSIVVPVTLSDPGRAALSVDYSVFGLTATDGVDFKPKRGVIRFTPNGTGLTPVEHSVVVPVLSDATVEGDETIAVVLSNPSAGLTVARASGVATIVDDDALSGTRVGVGDIALVRGHTGSTRIAKVPVTLAQPTATTVNVAYSVSSTAALAGVDYAANATGTVRFNPGQVQRTVTIRVFPRAGAIAKDVDVTLVAANVPIGRRNARVTLLGDPTCAGANTTDQLDVVYGPSNLDVHPVGGGCNTPIVVFVHGGGYCCGDKTNDIVSTIPWFHSQGWSVVSVNYRLNVRYPAFDDDVTGALRWVHAHASSFGGDGSRVVLLGHSTGAEMVAEIGTTPALVDAAAGVRCVGALDGTAYDIAATLPTIDAAGVAVYMAAYGSTQSGWRAASAITRAGGGRSIPPFLVVERGGDGGPARQALQQAFVAALRGGGVAVQVIDANSIGHAEVVTNIGAPSDTVMTAPMAAFLHACA